MLSSATPRAAAALTVGLLLCAGGSFAALELCAARAAAAAADLLRPVAGALCQPAGPPEAPPGGPPRAPPEAPEGAGWESQFAWGLYRSRRFLDLHSMEAEDAGLQAGPWATDAAAAAAAPAAMLLAEQLLGAAGEAPAEQRRAKVAERALQLYYHAKWLAERNHARAAEFRYRLAADLAKAARRSALAAHALSRLGYFLVQWRRPAEALPALAEADRLNGHRNGLARYLHAVLRRARGASADAIREAEDQLLGVARLPNAALEDEQRALAQEIGFWRDAEASPGHCLRTGDAAHALICLCAHGGLALREAAAWVW